MTTARIYKSVDLSPTEHSTRITTPKITSTQHHQRHPNQHKNKLYDGDLIALQRRLIASGFRLLKEGGIMVYSTCSLDKEQNEDVLSWLVEDVENKHEGFEAFVIPVSFS